MRPSVRILVGKELRELRADRRAVLLGLFLPVLLYPLLFVLQSSLQQAEEQRQARRASRVLITGTWPELRSRAEADSLLDVVEAEEVDAPRTAVEDGSVDLWVDAGDAPAPAGSDSSAAVRLVLRGTREDGRRARARVEAVLDTMLVEDRQSRWVAAGGEGRLDAILGVEQVDLATSTESGGAQAGRMLIYVLIMALFVSGSSLATDLVAGEKERGTLETLYLVPVPRRDIALSKVLVVTGGTALSGVLSLLSIALCYATGLATPAGAAGPTALSPLSLLAAAALVLPLAVLLGGVLLAISTYARSLKEAQYLVLPVMLLCFLPGLMAMSQAIELSLAVALLPIANVAFAMRDLLAGQVDPPRLLLVSAASVGWGLLVLRKVTAMLSTEEMVLGFDPEPLLAPTRGGRRRALLLGLSLTTLAYFYGGSLLQQRLQTVGLALSLWVLLPLLGLLAWRLVPGRAPWVATLSLRGASGRAWAGATSLALATPLPLQGLLLPLQDRLFHAPSSLSQGMEAVLGGLPLWVLFVLGAVSPAVCEELVFRGIFLGRLRRVHGDRQAVILSALFFGLIHLSIFRFAPTFLLGLALGWLVVASGSILPAMLYHLLYNGGLLLGGRWVERHGAPFDLDGPAAWTASLLLLATAVLLLRGVAPRRS